MQFDVKKSIEVLLLVAVLVLGFVLFTSQFSQFDIEGTTLALDVRIESFRDWQLTYCDTCYVNPPWSQIILLPLGALSFQAAWGAIGYMTLLVLLLAAPKFPHMPKLLLSVFLTVFSYLSLRTISDGNPETLVTLGTLFVIWGYEKRHALLVALGVLIVTYKPQSAVLLVLVLGIYMLQTWPTKQWLRAAIYVLALVIPTLLWIGQEWIYVIQNLSTQSSIMDSSLLAATIRADWPMWTTWVGRGAVVVLTLAYALWAKPYMTREKAGMLIAAGLIVAPYAAGNSALSIYAVGIVVMVFKQQTRWVGLILLILANALYITLGQDNWLLNYSAYYWTGFFILSWLLLGWGAYQQDKLLPKTRQL